MRGFTALLALGLATVSASAWAQDPADGTANFARLREKLQPGDAVVVRTGGGAEVRGRVLDLSTTRIAVSVDGDREDLAAEQVVRVQRRKNGIILGAIIGGSLGVYSGLAMRSWANNEGGDKAAATAIPIVIGFGAGIGIDAMLVRSRTVFERRE